MKKLLIPILCLALMITLIGCSNTQAGRSEAAIHVDRMIDSIGEVTLESESIILEAEQAVAALSDKEYDELANLQLLKDARTKYDELKYAVLEGNDKIAFDLIIQWAHSFKNPASIELVSGVIGATNECAFLCISATNSFGGTVKGYYYLSPDQIDDVSGSGVALCQTNDKLNVDKINRALEQELK